MTCSTSETFDFLLFNYLNFFSTIDEYEIKKIDFLQNLIMDTWCFHNIVWLFEPFSKWIKVAVVVAVVVAVAAAVVVVVVVV